MLLYIKMFVLAVLKSIVLETRRNAYWLRINVLSQVPTLHSATLAKLSLYCRRIVQNFGLQLYVQLYIYADTPSKWFSIKLMCSDLSQPYFADRPISQFGWNLMSDVMLCGFNFF